MVGEPNRVTELLPLENSTSSSLNFQATSPKINFFSCILHRARTMLKPRHQTDNEANKVVAIIVLFVDECRGGRSLHSRRNVVPVRPL